MFQFPTDPTLGQQFSPTVGITYQWDGTGWVAIGTSGSATELIAPPGVMMPYAGTTPFAGWLLCDGKSYATSSLPALFAVIGYTYGGSGAAFSVPDLRGRVIAGVDNMGGAAAGRLSAVTISPNANTLGGAGGAEQVTLTTANMASHSHGISDVAHSHGVSDPSHSHGVNDPGHSHGTAGSALETVLSGLGSSKFEGAEDSWQVVTVGGSATTGIGISGANTGISIAASGTGLSTTQAAGSGGGHSNVQPTIALNFIIKT